MNTLSEHLFLFFLCFRFILRLLIFNNFLFCFSNSGWGIGPSGGIVEPSLVERMRLDDGSDGNFSYGPSLSFDREPFVNERFLFSDGQYQNCRPYLEMEKEFFRENATIVREVFFDTDSLLGVDSEEDAVVEDAVEYEDLVPEILAEENQRLHAAAREIMEMNIERVSPVNFDSEDGETMERVTSPMVVEAVSDVAVASGATGSVDNGVNNQPDLVIAAEAGCVEKAVDGRANLPSEPGPFSEDVSMNDFKPRPRHGSVLFQAFSDSAGDEVSLYFPFSYPVVYFVIEFWRLIGISV
jgi:hypothetical protein